MLPVFLDGRKYLLGRHLVTNHFQQYLSPALLRQ